MIEVAYISTDKIISELEESFIEHYHEIPTIVSAPGRINFIGEHTDYNMGFVLPAAINQAVYVALSPNENSETSFVSLDFNDSYQGNISHLEKSAKGWPNYINGIVDQLKKKGCKINGFNCVLKGNIPMRAGMATSASIECAIIFALNEIFELKLDKMTMVDLCQQAENEFVGVHCGNLDFFAIMFAKKNYALKLDCRTHESSYVHVRMDEYRIVLFNTNVNRLLALSEYNSRRETCENAAATICKVYPQVTHLRDATIPMLDEIIRPQNEETYWMCRYVVEEIQRLHAACDDLASGKLAAFGKKLYETHDGLSKNFKVSCPELDYLVDFVKAENSVLGGRMMGAGFGGCTINLIKEKALNELIPRISQAYQKAMQKELSVYVYETAGGVTLIQ